jgi:DNA-binding MarR family transcriptional regulator
MARPDPAKLAEWEALKRTYDVVVQKLEAALLEERDLPLAWYQVLETLRVHRGRMRATELAEEAVVKPSTLSRQLDRLEDEGLIERDRPEADRRIVVVRITSEGRDVLRRATTTYARVAVNAMAAHLAAELHKPSP